MVYLGGYKEAFHEAEALNFASPSPSVILPLYYSGGDLISHCLDSSTLGVLRFHGGVREGILWFPQAIAARIIKRRWYRKTSCYEDKCSQT